MSINPGDNLNPAEIESLSRLEAVAQHGLETYIQVGNALAEIRDRHLYRDGHPSFEMYLRERWGVSVPDDRPVSEVTVPRDALAVPAAELSVLPAVREKPCEALARACEQTFAALAADERMAIEIRLALNMERDPEAPGADWDVDPRTVANLMDDELFPTLRWLLTQATGTIADVAHELETRGTDVDEGARAQLRDDVVVLDDELDTVKALLVASMDWDSAFDRLLKGKIPPLETEGDPGDDE